MKPAISVILLTTLIGAGQGLFIALYLCELFSIGFEAEADVQNYLSFGSAVAFSLLVAGLASSFFHLGHPERAWRSATMWRTSWLSREVIILPVAIALIALYGILHAVGEPDSFKTWPYLTLTTGALGVLASLTLFVCTGMIYACIKFLQEWSSPLTVINYGLLGSASGFTLAVLIAQWKATAFVPMLLWLAIVITLFALIFRLFSLRRNSKLRRQSTVQSATGIKHQKIEQKSMGFMGGSFNTREFFHRAAPVMIKRIRHSFLILVFPVPVLMLLIGYQMSWELLYPLAVACQSVGLLLERWYFFADANHPQNLYYQLLD